VGQEHELFDNYYTYFKRASQDCKSQLRFGEMHV
jgi:hypothetical protein